MRGLLATSFDLIGGFWPEKGEHLWCGSARNSDGDNCSECKE